MSRPSGFDRRLWSAYSHVYDGLLHFEPYRRLVAATVAAVPATASPVVDLGCGTGNTLLSLAELGAHGRELVGVDLSVEMLGRAESKRSPGAAVRFVHADVVSYLGSVEAGSIGCLISVNQLYTLAPERRAQLLAAMHRALDARGTLLLGNLTRRGLLPLVKEHVAHAPWYRLLHPRVLAVLPANAVIGALELAKGFEFTPEHALRAEVEAAGFDLRAAEPYYGGMGALLVAVPRPPA